MDLVTKRILLGTVFLLLAIALSHALVWFADYSPMTAVTAGYGSVIIAMLAARA